MSMLCASGAPASRTQTRLPETETLQRFERTICRIDEPITTNRMKPTTTGPTPSPLFFSSRLLGGADPVCRTLSLNFCVRILMVLGCPILFDFSSRKQQKSINQSQKEKKEKTKKENTKEKNKKKHNHVDQKTLVKKKRKRNKKFSISKNRKPSFKEQKDNYLRNTQF